MKFTDDRDIDLVIETLADAEAQYETLYEKENLTEEELLAAVKLEKFLYPDVEQPDSEVY